MQLGRLVRDLRHFLYPLLVGLSLCLGSAQAKEIVTYYHNDALGSPIAATDEKGNLLWREEYTPYGERILRQAEGREPMGYTGKPEEAGLGLTYFGARWYDPSLGRFLSPDPVPFQEDNPHSFNRYGYANANPYKFVDPDGAYFDLALEGFSIATGIASFKQNLDEGNIGAAILDGAGVVIDTGMAFVPGAAGGVGLGIKALREGAEAAGKSVAKGRTYERVVSEAELKATQETGLLRGGRPGENFFTGSASLNAKRAQQRLGLDGPLRDYRVRFQIKNDATVTGPRPAKPGQSGTSGGGREFSTSERTEIEIIRTDPLRK